MADIQRNWVAEAVAIVSGESRLLPEKEHLHALAAHAEQSIAKTIKIASILMALMVDNDMDEATIPGALVNTAKTCALEIEPAKDENDVERADGTIVLKLKRPAPPTPKRLVN